MKLSHIIEAVFKRLMPSPFTIAILLSLLSIAIAKSYSSHSLIDLLSFWERGMWNPPLLVFAFQMMLMLVLGHVLALTRPINLLIDKVSIYCNTTAKAASMVCFFTLLISLINWGLGLIFGAIFARKVAEISKKNNWAICYPIIGAAGYSGLMVWHGGISGSAPIKAAESGHIIELMRDIVSQNQIHDLPKLISFSETVFSPMNLIITTSILVILPLFMFYLGKISKPSEFQLVNRKEESIITSPKYAEKLDHSKLFAYLLGIVMLGIAFYKAIVIPDRFTLNFINPNFINFLLLAFCILFHGNFYKFLKAVNHAIVGTSGILIQFPIYFGIMSLMKESGMINQLSDFFVSISTEHSFPIYTLFSAGLVNIFVPSGGGQWAIQGPIIIEASTTMGLNLSKNIMALAYGDQLTNMLQPFWALPLLGITGLKAKEILPYTVMLMLVGASVFIIGLMIW